MKARILAVALFCSAVTPSLVAQAAAEYQAGKVFANVVKALRTTYYDRTFRREQLPALVERYQAAADAAASLAEEESIVHALLSEIPVSHLALYSKSAHESMFADLMGKPRPTFGMQLEQRAGKFFATWVYEGGPAERAGIKRGDRVLAIDGATPGRSERLDRRTDDAALPDPPLHALLCGEAGERIALAIERRPGERARVTVEAAEYSGIEAAKASVRVIESGGRRIGYVHFWFIYINGIPQLLTKLFKEDFADCDGLILDLRGRGGAGHVTQQIKSLLHGRRARWSKPFVALIDRGSRSAKEVIAYDIRKEGKGILVGEPTAGAVIPASFKKVGPHSTLMYPTMTLGNYTKYIEGKPVQPHVLVEDSLPYASGRDPILAGGIKALVAALD